MRRFEANGKGNKAESKGRPEDAVTRTGECTYDLAVIDVKMPRMSGIELKIILQKMCPRMKFIFLTGHGSQESYEAGTAEAGEAYYLMKPLKLQDFISKIDEVMGGGIE
jgi:DNA-binding NarL/FixJ family response regulator